MSTVTEWEHEYLRARWNRLMHPRLNVPGFRMRSEGQKNYRVGIVSKDRRGRAVLAVEYTVITFPNRERMYL